MKWVVTHTMMSNLVPTAVLLVGVLLALTSGWPASVFAGDWSNASAATTEVVNGDGEEATEPPEPTAEPTIDAPVTEVPPTEGVLEIPTVAPEPTEPPVPTPEPTPDVMLTATTDCTAGGEYAGFLKLVVANAPVTVTDVLAMETPGTTAPVKLAVLLPATLAPDTANWQWWLEGLDGEIPAIAPTALLVRVEDLPGTDAANQDAGDRGSGWLLAVFTPPVTVCPLPVPPSDATPAHPLQEGGGNATGSGSEPIEQPVEDTATATPETTPEPTPMPAPDPTAATPEAEPDTTATDAPVASPIAEATAVATIESAATTEASEPTDPDPIKIQVRSSGDGEARPGKSARYRFRITNTTDHPVTLRITTTDSAEGWTSTIYEADGSTELPAEVQLAAGTSIDVIVRVIPPVEARPGDQNTTALDTQAVERTTSTAAD